MPLRSIARSLPALLMTACLSGCVSIFPKASSTLECPQDAIETTGGPPVLVATGCGKRDALYFDGSAWASLREHAAFDLKCDARQLQVTMVDANTYGVDGCGKRAAYKHLEDAGFVMNTSSHSP